MDDESDDDEDDELADMCEMSLEWRREKEVHEAGQMNDNSQLISMQVLFWA